MITKIIIRWNSYILLTFTLFLLTGCIGGGGSGSSGGLGPVGAISGLGETLTGNGGAGETIAKIHNPEPATMLLFGSGMMAFGIYKKRKNSK